MGEGGAAELEGRLAGVMLETLMFGSPESEEDAEEDEEEEEDKGEGGGGGEGEGGGGIPPRGCNIDWLR